MNYAAIYLLIGLLMLITAGISSDVFENVVKRQCEENGLLILDYKVYECHLKVKGADSESK